MSERSAATPELEKQVVLILSTMRSGSTLLKALLAAAPDISNLPEIDFQKYQSNEAGKEIAALDDYPIIALKRPAWFNESNRYPKLPRIDNAKLVILTRDAHTNGLSLRKMVLRKLAPLGPRWMDAWIAKNYWAKVYGKLLERFPKDDSSNFWIRYEDLIQDPITHTANLFSFIGSSQTEGVDAYPRPGNYEWKWGTDDGGDKIQSLKVQAPKAVPQEALKILERVKTIPEVQRVREALGY